jgi:hypothetical protein
MKPSDIIDKINSLSIEVNSIIEQLVSGKENPQMMDIDLLNQKLISMYDLSTKLRYQLNLDDVVIPTEEPEPDLEYFHFEPGTSRFVIETEEKIEDLPAVAEAMADKPEPSFDSAQDAEPEPSFDSAQDAQAEPSFDSAQDAQAEPEPSFDSAQDAQVEPEPSFDSAQDAQAEPSFDSAQDAEPEPEPEPEPSFDSAQDAQPEPEPAVAEAMADKPEPEIIETKDEIKEPVIPIEIDIEQEKQASYWTVETGWIDPNIALKVEQIKPVIIKETIPEPEPVQKPYVAPEPKIEPVIIPEPIIKPEQTYNPPQEVKPEPQIIKPVEEKKPIFESISKPEKSLNEILAENKEKSGMSEIQKAAFTDFKSAITLNLKISFIRELFHGNEKDYKKMIDFLTRCENYSEARLYMQGEKEKHPEWEGKQDLINHLQELINRKFL